MTTEGRRDAATRVFVAVVIGLLVYLWPTVGGLVVAGLSAAAGVGRRA